MISLSNIFFNSEYKINLVSNYIGKVWTIILSAVLVPIYINLLGIESFALIGVFLSLQAIFMLFGTGLSSTLNREFSISFKGLEKKNDVGDLFITTELLQWAIGAIIALLIFILSSFIAEYWLNEKNLSLETVHKSIYLIGITIASQWPTNLYSGGLLGLQKHFILNMFIVIFSTIRGIGTVIFLFFISCTIETYFICQSIFFLFQAIALSILIRYYLQSYNIKKYKFDLDALKKLGSYASGVSTISLIGVIQRQADKIILSKLLTLDLFGYYVLANTIVSFLGQLVDPIQKTSFPKFTELISKKRIGGLQEVYHKTCQLVSSVMMPPALILIFFSKEILILWQIDSHIATNAYAVVSLIAIGKIMNVFARIPYSLHLAYGSVRPTLILNSSTIMVTIPIIYYLTSEYGIYGGACSLIIINGIRNSIFMVMTHKLFLKGDLKFWFIHDFFIQLCICLAINCIFRFLLNNIENIYVILALLLLSAITSFGFCILLSPTLKKSFKHY